MRMKLKELEKRIAEIKKALQPWKGMTWNEAREHGWGEEQGKLQLELWNLGQKITERKAYEKIRRQKLEEGIELEEEDFDWTEEE